MNRIAFATVLMAVAFVAGCAARTAPPVVTTPRHVDFIYPLVPDGAAALGAQIARGWQFLQGGDLRSAEREFSTALQQTPSATSAVTALGWVELARRDAEDALERFDRALSTEPGYVSALVGRGQALVELKREGDALSSFEAAIKADPSLTDLQARVDVLRFRATQDLLGRATSAAESGRLDDARAAYAQAIAASPDSAFLYRDLAGIERRAGQSAAAVTQLQRAIVLDPADARAHVALAELLEEQGDTAGALAAYEKARGIDPSAVSPSALTRVRETAAVLKLPPQYGAIAVSPQVTRAEVAALIGVRLDSLVGQARPQQVVITDIRGNWAQTWITVVVRAGIMETLANYQFEPATGVRRGDLARVVSRILSLIGALRPDPMRKWQDARVAVSDVAPSHLSYPAVSMAVAAGVMPLDGGAFGLLRPVSGAEASEVIGRLEALAK